jgi:hypothetical protein
MAGVVWRDLCREAGGASVTEFPKFIPELEATPNRFADPYPVYEALRRRAPVYRHPDAPVWIVTGRAEIVDVLKSDTFGHADLLAHSTPPVNPVTAMRDQALALVKDWVVQRNPPDHTRIRDVLRPHFTKDAAEAQRAAITAITDDLLDDIEQAGDVDLVTALARPLPYRVIAQIMGIPDHRLDRRLPGWAYELGLMVDPAAPAMNLERSLFAMIGLVGFFRDLHGAEGDLPKSGLLSHLFRAHREGALSEPELIANCVFLFVGGHLTTANLIANGAHLLLRHPDQRQMLSADPSLWPRAIPEILRAAPPIQILSRSALGDTHIGAHAIARGDLVHCVLGAAAHDPGRYGNTGGHFDICRAGAADTLVFGHGRHFCLGAPLSQLEGMIALQRLFERFPEVHLNGTPSWEENFSIHGPCHLPVRCNP